MLDANGARKFRHPLETQEAPRDVRPKTFSEVFFDETFDSNDAVVLPPEDNILQQLYNLLCTLAVFQGTKKFNFEFYMFPRTRTNSLKSHRHENGRDSISHALFIHNIIDNTFQKNNKKHRSS